MRAKRPACSPSPPPAARSRRGESGRSSAAKAHVASTSAPSPLINPATSTPFLGVALVPPTHPGDPPRYHGWAVPADGRRVSAGRGHATAEGAAAARDRAAIALKGRAAFEPRAGVGRTAGRPPALNYPLSSYAPSDDFQRTGEELAAFLKALARSGAVDAPTRPRPAARNQCGACDACRRPWLKRPCARKEGEGGAGGGRGAVRRAARTTAPDALAAHAEVAGPSAAASEAAAAAHAHQVGAQAAAAVSVASVQATARAARLAPGDTLDPAAFDDFYSVAAPASLEAWVPHDFGADLKAVAAAVATGRPVLVPRPGAMKREGRVVVATCALCGATGHSSLAACQIAGVVLAGVDGRGEEVEEAHPTPPLLGGLAAVVRELAARGDPWGGAPPLAPGEAVAAAAVALEAGLAVLAAGGGVAL